MTQDPRQRLESLLDELMTAMSTYRDHAELANEARLDWELALAKILPNLDARSVEERQLEAKSLQRVIYRAYRTTDMRMELSKQYVRSLETAVSAVQSLIKADVETDRATAYASRP